MGWGARGTNGEGVLALKEAKAARKSGQGTMRRLLRCAAEGSRKSCSERRPLDAAAAHAHGLLTKSGARSAKCGPDEPSARGRARGRGGDQALARGVQRCWRTNMLGLFVATSAYSASGSSA